MKPTIHCLLASLLLLLQLPGALAQSKVQVVTKTIERKLDYKKGDEVRLSGEKASISIKGWDKDYISLTLKLVAKHPDKAVAEQELEHLRYNIDKALNVHEINNYFLISKTGNPIKANLKAEYVLLVPESCPITLTAKYGDASLSQTTGRTNITLEYSKLSLTDVKGEMSIRSMLGDITGNNLEVDMKCIAEKADIELVNAAGSYTLENTYGHLRLRLAEPLKRLTVFANRTDVSIAVPQLENYNYDLSTVNSDLNLPTGRATKATAGAGGKRSFVEINDKKKPYIRVSTTSSPITLSTQSL